MPPYPESPRCLRPFQGNLFSLHFIGFQAKDRLTPRWYVGQTCAKASRHSLVGKPPGKASCESLVGKPLGKATDPLILVKGSVTLLLELGRKANVHAPTRDKYLLPWGDSRRTPRSKSALERIPQVPAPTTHKVLGPGIVGRGIRRSPRTTRLGTGLS